MSGRRTYLDYNASAPLTPEALAATVAAFGVTGNPSSVHAEGRAARALVEQAREEVAGLVGARPSEVVFTSGATEANVWVLSGAWQAVVHSAIEHDSILAPAAQWGGEAQVIGAGSSGVVDREAFAVALDARAGAVTSLATLQMANNETGVVQPVAELAARARGAGVRFHTDAVQAAGRVPIDVEVLGVDFLSLSSHKIGGPKGVGALVIRGEGALPPLIAGGGQEKRRRAGTENVAAIAGFGAAARAARAGLADMARVRRLRDRLEDGVRRVTPGAQIVGAEVERLANTSCIALPGTAAETTVIKLDLAGLAVSAGAACSSGKVARSHVLDAMGLKGDITASAIRVSLGAGSTDDDVAAFLAAWRTITSARVAA